MRHMLIGLILSVVVPITNGLIIAFFINPGCTGHNCGLETDPHCKAWWKFNNGQLTTDSKGSYTWSIGSSPDTNTTDYKEGDASADFEDGDSDYLYITGTTNDFNWNNTKEFTVCGWCKTETSYDRGELFSKFAFNKNVMQVFFSYDNKIKFYVGNSDGSGWNYYGHDSVLNDGQWYFVCVTLDSSNNYRIHIEDESGNTIGTDKTGTVPNTPAFDKDSNPRFSLGDSTGFDGLVDEWIVFDDVLSVSEMGQLRAGTY